MIFISHINEESKLALSLKEWTETTFSGNIDVFVSSDIDDIPAGSNWLSKIDSALNSSSLFLLLSSPLSLSRPWINFEAGCAWIKKVPLIPICHSGIKKGNLPSPLSSFQAIELDSSNFVDEYFQSIMKHLKISKLPRLDKTAMIKELRDALNLINYSNIENGIQPVEPDNLFDEKENEIIKFLSSFNEDYPTSNEIAQNLGLHLTECKYYLDRLTDNEYVSELLYIGRSAEYYLSKKGRKYAVENSLF